MATDGELAVVIMRGGTSKGVFCLLADLPAELATRDAVLADLMGSPDPMQLNGLGGTHSSTSKVVAVIASQRPGVDIEYLFAQVGIDDGIVDYAGNCGNLTAAVAPYALDEGLVAGAPGAKTTTVVLFNQNTGVRIRATVLLTADGRAQWRGDTAIDGVPGTGAPITTEYLDPAGSMTDKLFPTGSPQDLVDGIAVSVVDVASPHVFLRASDVGLTGSEPPAEVNANAELLEILERLRQRCGAAIGIKSAAIPRLILVSAPTAQGDIRVLATSMGRAHHATPITGALCTAAAVRLPGTVAAEVARVTPGRDAGLVRIEHPKGLLEATVEVTADGEVRSAGVLRTARRLLSGTAQLKGGS